MDSPTPEAWERRGGVHAVAGFLLQGVGPIEALEGAVEPVLPDSGMGFEGSQPLQEFCLD